MKKIYSLTIREHPEYGDNGIVIGGLGRDYFDPALRGMTCAHDILEHPVTPHPNGYIDELMAVGGIIAGRFMSGWYNKHGFGIRAQDIISDVAFLVDNGHSEGHLIGIPKISKYVQNSELMENIRDWVNAGVKSGLEEYFDSEKSYSVAKAKSQYDINSMVSYIVLGYRAYKKRFRNHDNYTISVQLFNRVTEVCDRFLKTGEEYQEAKLHVDFARCNAWVEEVYEEW